ncbi:A/G-specific adenine glycosylase [Halalkalibacillus halophilus]|uniref:A/G-specific adenine glycosylase n=1 Tax=Halalkalibacillus halophilus TaxID=392827 RepID=UPI0004143DDD|nr:A/G-specific adenine glycosylase [Halalkalibacillus halophilus]
MKNSVSFSIPFLFDHKAFQQALISWYKHNKRELPWRKSQNPYHIWVSEIMLQQTKVDTVIPYFNQFITSYPTVYDLANANEQEVLKHWEGLGYYSRARNLHTAVKEVVESYDGKVPEEVAEIKRLKGVGPYTEGAILSIAYNQPEPAVDGNVMRVMSRVLQIDEDIAKAKTRKIFEDAIREIISHEDPSSFNQGLMELGATICHPKKPDCDKCPVQPHCLAYELGIQEELPIKSKAKKQTLEQYVALVIRNSDGSYFIQKRPDQGLLANLYQFPMIDKDTFDGKNSNDVLSDKVSSKMRIHGFKEPVRHIFSHKIWEVDVLIIDSDEVNKKFLEGDFVSVDAMKHLPFPIVQQKILKQLRI